MRTAIGCSALLVAALAVASPASAHVLDEYLQATIVVIEPDGIRLRINLTPGVDIAWQVIELIDRNADGVISPKEAAAYANTLNHDLICRLDQRPVQLKLISCDIPAPPELHTGLGIIKTEFAVESRAVTRGVHSLALENRHFPGIGVFLFNAGQPVSSLIRIARQKRNLNQSMGEIEFSYNPPAKRSDSREWIAASSIVLVVIFAGIWRRPKRSRPSALRVKGSF